MLHLVLLALIVALVLPAAAPAAIVFNRGTECDGRYGIVCPYAYGFAADPGERNDVRLTLEPDAFVLRDAGAPLRSGAAGCERIDDHAVRCDPAEPEVEISGVRLDVSDGDDVVTVTGRGPLGQNPVQLGPGNDRFNGDGWVEGGPGDDVLIGGPAAGTLGGGPGHDVLEGGDGDDVLDVDDDGAPAGDRADGGAGRDTVTYGERRTGVLVDLGRGAGGGRGEDDALAGFEIAVGTAANDRLSGSVGDDELRGRDGDDVLLGGPGDDVLRPTDELEDPSSPQDRDHVRGGAGDDTVVGSAAGSTRCDAGDDLVDRAWRGSLFALHPTCELLRAPDSDIVVRPRRLLRRGRFEAAVSCPLSENRWCRAIFELRRGSEVVGRGERRVPEGTTRLVRVPVDRRTRTLARRRGGVRLVLVTDLRPQLGERRDRFAFSVRER